jgi:hypothetical protein
MTQHPRRRELLHLLPILAFANPARAEPTAEQIAERSAQVDRVPAWSGKVTVVDSQDGEARRQRTGELRNLLGDNGRDFMRHYMFTGPQDIRGTVLLIHEHTGGADDLWLYLPALGRSRRIAGSGRKNSFVGTQYSFFDLTAFDPGRYRHSLAGEAQVDGKPCWVLESVPRDERFAEDIGRSKLRSWVVKDSHLTVRVDHHDTGGNVFKRHTLGQFVSAGSTDLALATQRVMTHLQTGASTSIVLGPLNFQPHLAARDFSPNNLMP